MRNIFLDDEAIEDEGAEDLSFAADENPCRVKTATRHKPNSYGEFLLHRLNNQDVSSYSSTASPTLSSGDQAAVDRNVALMTSVRSDDDEEEDDTEYDAELADFIVSDNEVESCLSESVEESWISSTDSILLERPSRLKRRKKPASKDFSGLPPHPRFAFDPQSNELGVKKEDCCCVCKKAKSSKSQWKPTLAVRVELEAKPLKLKSASQKPQVESAIQASAAGTTDASPPLDYAELIKAAAYQTLTVNVPDGFGGDLEVIPSEQWMNLDVEGDTEYNSVVYVRGSSRQKGHEDYLVLLSSSSERKPSSMKFGSLVADVITREICTKVSMIPIREIDATFRVSGVTNGARARASDKCTALSSASGKPDGSVIMGGTKMMPGLSGRKTRKKSTWNTVPVMRAVRNGSKVDARKVILSATKLRRERWQSRIGRRLRLFRRITRHLAAPLLEAARNAGYNYLHGPAYTLPSSMPPLPNPAFPDRKMLRKLLKPPQKKNSALNY
eukprot:Gregarina_sp_Poly_1__5139@NODE_271_length_10278_cov_119_025561_g236_i0_p3_GENE_NODE_271_length_10278_cov_119_025561_g236_i0NODE_271_length_10278_cov_119_025561_g236_i0_p3_ORF_typecomplete_len500_score80_70SPT6_acidic/PF14632_6/3_8e03SPT6_acidic/PF14632_6/0_0094Spt5_N/PF11942_8/1_8e03Spt5_N/PF11942_8/0_42_NODE_271_length_10278_cov_119_025561_g236_i019503449